MTKEEYQMIIDVTQERIDYRIPVQVFVDDIPCGRGYYHTKIIQMPRWLEKYDLVYQIYYVLHELCHCIIGIEHSKSFKMYENLLLGLWNIRIVRRSVYPKKLYFMGVECNNTPFNAKTDDFNSEKCA